MPIKTVPDSDQIRDYKIKKLIKKLKKNVNVLILIILCIFGSKVLANTISIESIHLQYPVFSAQQDVVLNTGYYNLQDPSVKLVHIDGAEYFPEFTVEADRIVLNYTATFEPGEYTFILFDENEVIFEENFKWGVLVLNTNKPIYKEGDEVHFAFGVLDPEGYMVCNANIELTISNQSQAEDIILTTPDDITVNEECEEHISTLVPDYEAVFLPEYTGTYNLTLKTTIEDIEYTIYDKFKVEENTDFEIERISATRLYPISEYPVVIKIKANVDFEGIIKETLPLNFSVSEYLGDETDVIHYDLEENNENKNLIWNVNLQQGESIKIGFNFDPPDISPEVYRLGKLEFITESEIIEDALDLEANESTESSESFENTQESSESSETNQEESSNTTENQTSVQIVQTIIFEELRYWLLANDAIVGSEPDRILTMGFEMESAINGDEIDQISGAGLVEVTGAAARTGGYGLRTFRQGINNSSSNVTWRVIEAGGTNNQIVARMYFKVVQKITSYTEDCVLMMFTDASGNRSVSLKISSTTQELKLWNEITNTQIGSSSSPISTETFAEWYRAEVLHDTTNNRTVFRLDGEVIAFQNNITLRSNINRVSFGIFSNGSSSDVGEVHIDDIAINRNAVAGTENWPGPGNIIRLMPNGDGVNSAWTRNTGNNDFEAIDETGRPDNNTSYISCNGINQLSDFTLTDTGLDKNSQIRLAEVWKVSGASTTGARRTSLGFLYNTTADMGPEIVINSSTYLTNDDNQPMNADHVIYNTPGSYRPLTPQIMDSMQVRINSSTDCTPNVRVTLIWVYVEYIPQEGGRLFSSGFELQSTGNGVEWTTGTNAASSRLQISTTANTFRSGDASLLASPDSSSERSLAYTFSESETNTLFSSGFEFGMPTPPVNPPDWTTFTGIEASRLATSTAAGTFRSGSVSLLVSPNSTSERSLEYNFKSQDTEMPLYFSMYIRIATAPNAPTNIIQIENSSGTAIATISLNNSRVLSVYNTGEAALGSSSALALNTWHLIEVNLNANNEANKDILQAKLNGTSFYSSSARDFGGISTLVIGANIPRGSRTASSGLWYFDDLSIKEDIPLFVRTYLRIATAPASETNIIQLENSAGTGMATISLNQNRVLNFYDNLTPSPLVSLGTSSPLSLNKWYRIELKLNSNDTASGVTKTEVRLDDVTFYSSSSRDLTGGVKTLVLGANIARTSFSTSTSGLWYFDDVAINTNVGNVQNSFPGPGNIVHYKPDGNGNNNIWNGAFGNVNDVYGANEPAGAPKPGEPNDSTVITPLNALPTVNVEDYTLQNTSGLTNSVITLASAGFRFKSATSLSAVRLRFCITVNVQCDTVVTEVVGASDATWHTNQPTEPKNYPITTYTQPLTNDAWTSTALDGALIGVKNEVGTTTTFEVSTMWTLVEYYDTISISGTCNTNCPGQSRVFVAINGQAFGTKSSSQNWTISGVPKPENNEAIITTFLYNSNDSIVSDAQEAITITEYSGSGDITGVALNNGVIRINAPNETVTSEQVGRFSYTKTRVTIEDLFFTSNGNDLIFGSNTFSNSSHNNSSTTETLEITATTTLLVEGNLTAEIIDNKGTINMGTGGHILEINNPGSTANVFVNTGTFTPGTSTVKYSATNSVGNINVANVPYNNLQIAGAETYVLTGNQTTAASKAISGNLTINSGATLSTVSNYSIDLTGNFTNSGTFTANAATINITGNFSISSGGTFNANTANLTISGNFSNGGTFNANTGTVTISGTGTESTITSTNNMTFYNFTSTTSSNAKTIKFQEGKTFTFANQFHVKGTATHKLTITSTSASTTKWIAYFQVAQPVSGSGWTNEHLIISKSGCTTSPASQSINVYTSNNNTDGGNNDSCWVFSPPNTAPGTPTSLAQKKTSDVTITTGQWINETSVKFSASVIDVDSSDTLYLCVEYKPLLTDFNSTESCGSGFSSSGSAITVSHTITGIANGQYHWQARVKDALGTYSSWVSFGGNAESASDFGIDTVAPTLGSVFDGDTSGGTDYDFNNGSLSELKAHWSGFSDVGGSGIQKYEYIIGTTAGGSDIKALTNNSTNTNFTVTSLNLKTSQQYFTSVRAVDDAGNTSSYVVSDGIAVAPTLSFSISPTNVVFGNLTLSNDYTDTKTTTLTTSTNAYNGYRIRAYKPSLLTLTQNSSYTIPNFSGGTYATPDVYQSNEYGFGYTSSDSTVGGSNRFCVGSSACYAPFSATGPGDVVAENVSTVTGSPITNEAFTITYKLKINVESQVAGMYVGTIIYTVIPTF